MGLLDDDATRGPLPARPGGARTSESRVGVSAMAEPDLEEVMENLEGALNEALAEADLEVDALQITSGGFMAHLTWTEDDEDEGE